ncbi:MAG: Ribosomal silencing factor RsfA, partial [uncultured Rubrobacteraceae bacterium]
GGRVRRPAAGFRDRGRGVHAPDGRDGRPGGGGDVRQGRDHHRPARSGLVRGLLRGGERRDRPSGEEGGRRGHRQDDRGRTPPPLQAGGRGLGLDQPGLPRRRRPRLHGRGAGLLPPRIPLAQRPPGALGGV